MKRNLAAVAFSALAVPALADNRPFEQTELDRALPEISVENASAGSSAATAGNLPFEQTELDRQVPNVAEHAGKGERTATGFVQYDAI